MDELLECIEATDGIELLLEEVLHCLHVVIGHLLDRLHSGSILFTECLIDGTQLREELLREGCQLGKRQLAQGNEVLHFNPHAITYQGIL